MPLVVNQVRERPEWPVDLLDVSALVDRGWRPVPISQFLLKVHSRCNLACSYCYIYEGGDESWRTRPRTMSDETLRAAATRIGEHAVVHGLEQVEIVFHGGEPLLVGADFLGRAVDLLHAALPAGTALDASVQTNGTLLDEATLDALLPLDVRVGVSIDGTDSALRLYPDGKPSAHLVEEAVRRLAGPRYRSIYAGLLCVIDLDHDPLAVYERLCALRPPRLDFLLPHGDWSSRPPGRPDDLTAPFAEWLIRIFDRWYTNRGDRPGIRLFDEIIHLLLGGHSRTEAVGLSPAALLVIETDGALEQVDALRTGYPGAAETGLHVLRNTVDEALFHPGIAARQLGIDALADECRSCRFGRICGGGFYGHRYRAGTGFRHPSVYCADLFALIAHIKSTVAAEVRAHRRLV